jgi:hypothetical protein
MELEERPASTIPPGHDPVRVTYDQVCDILTKYIGSLDYDLLESQLFGNGHAKQPPTSLKTTQLIQCLNMLMFDFIKSNNQSQEMSHNNIISGYFEGVNRLAKILDVTDIKVAETKMLCYIMGYLLKLIKHFKDSEEQNNTTR